MRQRSRFGRPFDPNLIAAVEATSSRTEIFTPTRGLHRGDAPQDIAPGFTPDAANFVNDAGHLRPRSGLSRFKGGVSHLSGPALGAWKHADEIGNAYLVAASDRTLTVFDPTADSWSTLSYVKPSTATSLPSGTSRNYWEATYIYDSATNRNLAILTNNVDIPKSATLKPSMATYSDVTDFASLASRAKAVCAFDSRLVWFNVSSSASSYPQRVMWSPRGLPSNYQLASGAGYEDLLDMQGIGQKILAERDGVVLFGDEQIWRGRKRNDAYTFDFYPVEREFGCPYPRTIVATPRGIIFLGADFELYALRGESIEPLGGVPSRIQPFLREEVREAERAWATYNRAMLRYELYYTGPDSTDGYATRAVYFSILEESFMPQRFNYELTSGVCYNDPGVPETWDGSFETWDEIATGWDSQIEAGTGYYVNAFTSNGTAYRFHSSSTNDDGSAFTAYWTSHALNRADQMEHENLSELWMEYRSDQASSVSVEFGRDLAFSESDVRSVSLPARAYGRALVPGFINGVSPHFKLQITDGSRPKIARFQARLTGGGLYGGAA